MTTDRRKSWSGGQDAELLALKAAGDTVPAIAEKLGRTATAVGSRVAHLKRERRLLERVKNKPAR